MSIPVAPSELAEVVARFGSAYLLTREPGGFVRVLTVDPEVVDEEVVLTSAMAVRRARGADEGRATLVWPPPQRHGFSLIVDGFVRADDDRVRVALDHAVLHRPAEHRDGPPWSPPGHADGP